MFQLTSKQKINILILFSFFHILIITSSNYLVQLPIIVFGFHTTWGVFTFPFIFLTTDLTVRIYGSYLARRIIAMVMLPALSVSYIFSTLFYQGEWQGFAILNKFNLFVTRIAFASFMAYILGQIMDIFVFNKLRNYHHWWIAPTVAMFFGNLLDTMVFFFIAFYRSTAHFMSTNWIEIALIDYGINLLIYLLFFLPAYKLMTNFILKHYSYN